MHGMTVRVKVWPRWLVPLLIAAVIVLCVWVAAAEPPVSVVFDAVDPSLLDEPGTPDLH
jgi:hypothetical protein